MKNSFNRIIILILIIALILIGISGCNNKQNKDNNITVQYGMNNDAVVTKQFASLVLNCTAEEFLKTFSYSDIISVKFEGKDLLQFPVCGEYDDVSPGELVCRVNPNDNSVIIAINYGQLGMQLGFVETSYSNEYKYRIKSDVFPSTVTVSLVKKSGYADRIAVGKLKSSNDRSAYPNLTDEEFCNFREIVCGTIGANKLYRSSSPIDDSIGRNVYVDSIIEKIGINTAVNMTDDEEEGIEFEGYNDTYYSTTEVGFLKMSLAFRTSEFDDSIVECMRFIANNDGPYLIHCVYGKDRTGFLCAMLEALCGASYEYIVSDYVKTYENLFDVQNDVQTPISNDILKVIGNIIIDNMSYAYNTTITADNIGTKTEEYLLQIGLTESEISTIRAKLA